MLLLKKHGEGWLSRWHGRFKVGGKTREVALCRWKGVPPASGRIGKDKGDSVFEASRQRALEELKQIAEGGRSEADKAAAAERVYRARYEHRAKRGRRPLAPVRIDGLYDVWQSRPRKKKPTPGRAASTTMSPDRKSVV